MKRGIVLSDIHCGHQAGLTPPEYHYKNVRGKEQAVKRRSGFADLQREMWSWYANQMNSLGKLDFVFLLGDMIDGPGGRGGGAEHISTDTNVQVEIATRVIEEIPIKRGNERMVMVYGTPYHTGDGADCEDIIAANFGAKIGGQEWVDVNGVMFHLKHKVGRSGVPHTKGTAISREWLTETLWNWMDLAPKAEIIIRGHVHYPFYVGDPSMPYLAMTAPSMQWSSKFGVRQAVGTVALGYIYFEINEKGEYSWQYKIAKLQSQKAKALKI